MKHVIPPIRTQKNEEWTTEYNFLAGTYEWMNNKNSNVILRYYLTNIPIKNLHLNRDILLMQDLDGRGVMSFDELFQREIDENRIQRELVNGYLKKTEKIKFFTPVTILLLPVGSEEQKLAKTSYDSNTTELTVNCDGLRLKYYQASDSIPHQNTFGSLSWDKTKYRAIAIDGQHRISALRKFTDAHDEKLADCFLPATFIWVEHITSAMSQKRKALKVARELFIDVNKNAEKVSESRLILLDDRDVVRRITRELVCQVIDAEGEFRFPEPKQHNGLAYYEKIPQIFINYQIERKDADTNSTALLPWQLTSTNTVYRILRDFVFKQYTNNAWKMFKEYLDIKSLPDGNSIKQAVLEEEDFQKNEDDQDSSFEDRPVYASFSFDEATSGRLVERFFSEGPGIVFSAIFTAFEPYAKVIDPIAKLGEDLHAKTVRSIIFSRNNWKQVLESVKKEDREQGQLTEKLITGLKEENPDQKLYWLSVGQRAFLSDLSKVRSVLGEVVSKTQFNSWLDVAIYYVSALNMLFRVGIFSESYALKTSGAGKKTVGPWAGTWIKHDDTTDYKDSGALKIAGVLRLLIVLPLLKKYSDAQKTTDIIEYIEKTPSLQKLKSAWVDNMAKYIMRKEEEEPKWADHQDKYRKKATRIIDDYLKTIYDTIH